jgi:Family of unknown function (DUF5906)
MSAALFPIPRVDASELTVRQYFIDRGATDEIYAECIRPQIEIIEPGDSLWYRRNQISYNHVAGRVGHAIAYLDPDGKPYMRKDKKGNDVPYKFVRWHGEPVGVFEKGQEPAKGSGPWGRPSEVHFPLLIEGTYAEAAKAGRRLVHMESGAKAMISYYVARELSAGLSGVYGFQSAKHGVVFRHAELPLEFKSFNNVVLFDSNTDTNWMVRQAEALLCYHLRNTLLCPQVAVGKLPKQTDGTDWGPDDFIADRGVRAYGQVLDDAQPYTLDKDHDLVERVNERAVYLRLNDMVVTFDPRMVKNRSDAAAALRPIKKPKGKAGFTYGFDAWLESDMKNCVDDAGYRYLGPERFKIGKLEFVNLYTKSGVWPVGEYKDSDSSAIRGWVDRIINDADDVKLFWQWFRFLKFSDRKPVTWLCFYSAMRGVGKGWLLSLMHAVIGEENSETGAGARDFITQFNDLIKDVRLLGINEFTLSSRNEKEAARESIKNFVGDKRVRAETKFVAAKSFESNAGLVLTINELHRAPTDGLDDRRVVPICFDAGRSLQDNPDWVLMHDTADGKDGIHQLEALTWWLQHRVAEVNFSTWRPPVTAKRIAQLGQGLDPVARVAFEIRALLLDGGDGGDAAKPAWETADKRCWTMKQIEDVMGRDYNIHHSWTPATMAKFLREAGWLSSGDALGDVAGKDGRVGEGKLRTNAGVWFPCQDAATDADGNPISSRLAGEHAAKAPFTRKYG